MTISALGSTPGAQLQALAVTNVVEGTATSPTSGQTASSIVKAASGMRVSSRTAQSLTDIIQASQPNLGYSKDETKNFMRMIDKARTYLDNIKTWAAQEAAAVASTDPAKIAIDANPSPELQAQQQKVATYDKDFIANFESGLDQIMTAFLDHTLVFKSFSIGATGDANIMANTYKTTADGKTQVDMSFSFFQSQAKDTKTDQFKEPPEYNTLWSVNDLRLFDSGPVRVL